MESGMAIVLGNPGVGRLSEAVDALREWQYEGAPMQLHPGDLGAAGLLDGPTLQRLTIAPDAQRDEELARRLVDDLTEPKRGVLMEGKVYVEAPIGALVHDLLSEDGWNTDEPRTPLRRDLTKPVKHPGVRIEVIGPEQAPVRTAVQRASFDGSTFTDERWHVTAAGLPYAEARCLVAYDDRGSAVAAVTVWSAGPGKPGLLEPMGVQPGTPRPRLPHGDYCRCRGRTPAAGVVERDRLHPELQHQRHRHVQVSRLPATAGGPGPRPAGLVVLRWVGVRCSCGG